MLLGKILTDEDFRRSFFPVRTASFEVAAALGLDLTAVEQSALRSLRRRRFDFIGESLDPRISRSGISSTDGGGGEASVTAGRKRDFS